MVTSYLQLHKKWFTTIIMILWPCFVGGLIIDLLYTAASAFFPVGMLLGAVILTYACMFFGWSYARDFSLALTFGKTRKDFMISYALELLIWALLSFVLLIVMSLLEYGVCLLIFKDMERSLFFMLLWPLLLPLIPIAITVNMFFGSLYAKWGTSALLLILLLKMGASSLNQIDGFKTFRLYVLAVLLQLHWSIWVIICVICFLLLINTIIRLGKRQALK